MSDAFWMSFFGFLATLVTTGITLYNRRQSAKEHQETKAIVTNGLSSKLEDVHQTTVAVKDELATVAATVEFAKGVAVGRAQVLAEQAKGK